MVYQIKEYLKFLLRSTNQHGVHSPFVYSLVAECFYDKKKYPEYHVLVDYRKALLNDSSTIEVQDFGQGSRIFNDNRRGISAIAKNAGISEKRQRLLFRLIRFLECNDILELGTSLGLGTAALSMANPKSNIASVEGCRATAAKAQHLFNSFGMGNIELNCQIFEEFLSDNVMKIFDLVYIDGNHNKEKTLEYFNVLLQQKKNNSVIILDDIYWSKAMNEAWREIISRPEVTVSIDTFQWGLVFFRKEQPKQHFSIRV